MSLLDSLPHTATAKRRTRTPDEYGGTRDEFPTTLFKDRECWQQQAGNNEVTEFQKRGISFTNTVYFIVKPELVEQDILVITNAHTGEVRTFEVRSLAVPDASAGLGCLYSVMCEHTTTGSAGVPD